MTALEYHTSIYLDTSIYNVQPPHSRAVQRNCRDTRCEKASKDNAAPKRKQTLYHNAHVNFTVPHRDRATNVVLQAYLSGFRFSVSSRLSKLA